jgi:outer membrane protein insertion porin family
VGAPVLSSGWRQVLPAALLLAALSSVPSRGLQPTIPPAPDVEAAVPAAGEPVVTSIELLSDAPIDDVDAALELITLTVGAPYDEREARRTLRNLDASGLAAEAEVWTRPDAAGGLIVMAAIWGNVLVESVELLGDDRGLKNEALRRELQVKEGEPLLEDRVVRSVFRLQDRYRAEGYFDATARTRVAVDTVRKRARVAFALAAGPRAEIGQVAMEGTLGPFTPAQLVAELRARPGESYRQSTVRDDAERLRRWLHEQGYRQAEVDLLSERYDAADHLVDLAYRVEAHGKLTVHVEGAELGTLRRKDLLPFLGDQGYDEAVVLQAVGRITRFYQERGHYRVQVEHREEEHGEDTDLTLVVRPGPEYTLREVRFTGNEGVAASQLAALMTTGEKRLLVAGSGKLVDEVLATDLDNVRSYYALSGWAQAKVGPPEVGEEGERELVLTIPIVEGPRTRVVDLIVEGVRSLDVEALRKALPLQPGGPFHPRRLDETLDFVRGRYEGEGYPYAQVSASTDWNDDRTLVDVTLRVIEGPRQVAANVIVRGNRYTHTGVVRMLAGVVRGEPLSRRRLLEVQRNLYRIGIFSRVDVTLAPSSDSVRERDVVIEVEEGRNQRVAYGVGYDSEEGFGGLIGYSQGNLFGRALHFQLDARASQRSQRFRLLLEQPYASGQWPGSINYLLYQDSERRPTFRVDQRGALAELARGRDRLRLSLFADYRNVELGPGDDSLDLSELPLVEQRAFQDIKILSLVPRVVWDERDDPVDSHRGSQLIAQAKYAFPAGGLADEHFFELFGQLVRYWDLRALGVLAASVRAGGIEPLSNQPVSIAERFFAGGRTTHRAYGLDELGIPGETLLAGKPIGGKGLFLFNVDYRFPLVGSLGGTVFVDAGNVWADWRHLRLQEIKPGAGLGVRYLTPIGPLRVEVGWKLDREPGESESAVLVSFGNAF